MRAGAGEAGRPVLSPPAAATPRLPAPATAPGTTRGGRLTCTPGMTSALSSSSPRPCRRCTASTPTSPPRKSRHDPNSGCSEAAPAPSSATRYSVGLFGRVERMDGWWVAGGVRASGWLAAAAAARRGHRPGNKGAGSALSRERRTLLHLLRMRPAEPRSSCANSRMTDCVRGGGESVRAVGTARQQLVDVCSQQPAAAYCPAEAHHQYSPPTDRPTMWK